jgi:hypothetical protein
MRTDPNEYQPHARQEVAHPDYVSKSCASRTRVCRGLRLCCLIVLGITAACSARSEFVRKNPRKITLLLYLHPWSERRGARSRA